MATANKNPNSARYGQQYRTVARSNGDVLHVYKGGKRVLVKKTPAPSLPHPGYDDKQFAQLVQSDPNLTQLRQQNAASKQTQANTSTWFDAYKQALQAANAQSNAGYGAAVTNTQQAATAARGLDDSQAAALLAAARADAAQRGASVDPKLAADLASAAASRQAQGNQYAALTGTLGANANSYLGSRTATSVGQKAQLLTDEQARANALARQYGSTKSATALKLSGDLQNTDLQRQVAAQTLGLNVAKAQTTANTAAQAAKDRAANRKLARMKFNSAQEKDAYERSHHLGPYKLPSSKTSGGISPKDVSKISDKAIDAINQARQLIKKYSNLTDSQLRQAFANGYYTTQTTTRDPITGQSVTKATRIPIPKIATDYVNSALDIERLGGLGAVNVKRLHARHVKIGGRLPVGATKGVRRSSPGGDVQSGGGYQGIG